MAIKILSRVRLPLAPILPDEVARKVDIDIASGVPSIRTAWDDGETVWDDPPGPETEWMDIDVSVTGDITGPIHATKVEGIRGNRIVGEPSFPGDVLAWTGSHWEPRRLTNLHGFATPEAEPIANQVLAWTGTRWEAMNVRQLAGRPVAASMWPATNQHLIWSGSEWRHGNVEQLQGRRIGTVAPRVGQAYMFNGSEFEPVSFPIGASWSLQRAGGQTENGENFAWQSVAFGGGYFRAVGTDGRGMLSTDGNSWGMWNPGQGNNWQSTCFGRRAVAVASTGTNRVATADAMSWTLRDAAAQNEWTSVIYLPTPDVYIAVAQSGTNRAMTSRDGITWTSSPLTTVGSWRGLAGSGSTAIAVGGAGNNTQIVRTINSGGSWTAHTCPSGTWNSLAFGNSRWVAVGSGSTAAPTNRVMTSDNGTAWTAQTAPQYDWRSITFAFGIFCAVAQSGTGKRVMTSRDGIIWNLRDTPADNNWQSVTFGLGRFIAVANSGTGRVMASP